MKKETSDTLNPAAMEAAHVVVAPSKRTGADYVALGVATCGVGLIPFAPGTWGSAVGVCLYLLIRAYGFGGGGAGVASAETNAALLTSLLLVVIIAVSLAGAWAATRCERLVRRKDPGVVVIDEVAGQLITFLFVPWGAGPWAVAAGFLAFRLFDIWKPYPINRLEALESGLGVMADDVLAGAYAATLLSLLTATHILL